MPGIGTLINAAAIIVGGILGALFGRRIKERTRDTLEKACGLGTFMIGLAGALSGMLSVEGSSLTSGRSMLLILSLVPGALIGELLDIEGRFERFGEWLKRKTGNGSDAGFVNAFVTASLTVCIGAMAIVGAIRDGIARDPSILITKAALDLVLITVMTGSMGKGCAFSAIPVFALQFTVTLLAQAMKSVMTDAAVANLSLTGSVLICAVGVNLVWGKRIRVANLLPAVVLAAAFAFAFPTL